MKRYFIYWFFTLLLFVSTACSKNPVTGKRDFMLLSKEQEIAMGKQSDPEIVAYFGLYEDTALQQFIEQKGQKMAAVSHRSDLSYEFKIVDSPVINAFAVPGGYVYFTRGIMAHFNNEAEFAGVLGHEIGHIAARHSAKQYSKAMLAQVGLVAGMVIAPEFQQFADIAQQGVGLLFLKFGRDAERESDRLGVEYSTKIGYDAQEMAEFFLTLDRVAKESGAQSVPTFLSTHPDPQDRLERVTKLAAEWKKKAQVSNLQVNRNAYLKMIDGITYGEDPRQGFVENSTFYHPQLAFQFRIPQGWTFQNTPQQVQMAPKDGKALLVTTLAKGESLQAAAEAVIKNNQLRVVESRQDQVNGLPAVVMIAEPTPQEGQQQGQIRALIYLIGYGGNIYQMMGISTLNDFNAYLPVFNSTVTSFGKLTDPSKLNRKPDRISVKPARAAGTLAQVLAGLQVDQDKMQELAILNGMQLEERVEQGTLIKVIESGISQ